MQQQLCSTTPYFQATHHFTVYSKQCFQNRYQKGRENVLMWMKVTLSIKSIQTLLRMIVYIH
jgi:hypothetical protein